MTALELLTYIHEKQLIVISKPMEWLALRIAVTLPMTVATAERSFSKLKLIKTYLRSTMAQERLSGLAIMSINREVGRKLSYDDIIDEFAIKRPGEKGFEWCIETDFAPQLKELGSKDIEALFWDPPGYGKSRPPSRDFSSNFFHNDCRMAVLLMKELGYDKYSLLGWSDGAVTAIHMALNYPDKIEKLVVWGANGFFDEKAMKVNEGMRDVSKWSERMRKPMEDVYGAEYFKTKWEEWVDAVFRIYRENNGVLYERDLTTITCPTLIIHGKKDPFVRLEHADYLHERIKNSELVVFENGKHNLHLRYAQEFNDLVTEFLKR